jgi:glyoxylase-like metal-dependent hydrolase (beta-lactamase superfamily II)
MLKGPLVSEFTLQKISEHVYWMNPGDYDRPSLCAVVGTHRTLMLDAGASTAHTRLFLDALQAHGIAAPSYVVLTHWHWDHLFGAETVNVPIIAHSATAAQLAILAGYDWNNAALDERVASGEEIAFCADNIKLELPEPREVNLVLPDIIFHDTLDFDLGGVTCHVQHVGGDHAADSCIVYIASDRVMFLGDCLYDAIYTPVRHYTSQQLFPLLDTVLGFEAVTFIEGHNPNLISRAELETMAGQMRLAGALVEQWGTDEQNVLAHAPQPADEDTLDFIRAFIAGKTLGSQK